jgi:hypothetical protein
VGETQAFDLDAAEGQKGAKPFDLDAVESKSKGPPKPDISLGSKTGGLGDLWKTQAAISPHDVSTGILAGAVAPFTPPIIKGGIAGAINSQLAGHVGHFLGGDTGEAIGQLGGAAAGFIDPSTVPALAKMIPFGIGKKMAPTLAKWFGEEPGLLMRIINDPKSIMGTLRGVVGEEGPEKTLDYLQSVHGLSKRQALDLTKKIAAKGLEGGTAGGPPAPPAALTPPAPSLGDRMSSITKHLLEHPEEITHVQNEINAATGPYRAALRKALRAAIDQMGE